MVFYSDIWPNGQFVIRISHDVWFTGVDTESQEGGGGGRQVTI